MKWALALLLLYVAVRVYLEWRKARRWEREMLMHRADAEKPSDQL